jgi:hypothetical protein
MPKSKSQEQKTEDNGHKVDNAVVSFFGGLRQGAGGRSGARTSKVENWLTSDEQLDEKTRLHDDDVKGIATLRIIGAEFGVPEFERQADRWEHELVARDGERALMLSDVLKAQIFTDLEMAKIEAKKAETSQRERVK